MAFESALNGTQLGYLRGSASDVPDYRASLFLSVCPNNNVYTARVNMTPDRYPVTEIIYDGGSGTLANVRVGMTVLISHTSDRALAYFRGRVRKTPTASRLYVNESGELSDLTDNDYIFILDDFAIHEILPADVAGKPVPDLDTEFRQLRPLIYNLPSAVAKRIATGASSISKSFAPGVIWAAAGDTAGTYLWEIGDGTFTSGSSSTQNITATFPEGFRWIHFTATSDDGYSTTFHIPVWSHGTAYPPAPLGVDDLQFECSLPMDISAGAGGGYNASVVAFDGVSAILDNTLVVAWGIEIYNGTTDPALGSAGNLWFVGRFRNEGNQTGYRDGQIDKSVSFDLEGVLSQLAGLPLPPMEILNDANPDEFNEIKTLTIWRAVVLLWTEYTTAGSLHSLSFDESGSTYLYGPGVITQGQDLLYSIADLLQSINAMLMDNAAGMCQISRRGTMLPTADRSALITVINLTTADYGSEDALRYERDYQKTTSRLTGDGGAYNSSFDNLSALLVRAPRGTLGRGVGEAQLSRQILTANASETDQKTELTVRAGHAFAASQPPEVMTLRLMDGYHFLTPDVAAWYTITVGASETVRGRVFDTSTRWWLQAISKGYNIETGEIDLRATFVRETSGPPGEIYTLPAPEYADELSPGDFGDLIPPPPSDDTDEDLDLGDGDIEDGTYVAPNIESACSASVDLIDTAFSLGTVKTIKSVTISYVADANVPDTKNTLYLAAPASFWRPVGEWNTLAGTHSVTFELGGQAAQFIRVKMYGDDDACTDGIILTGISYTTTDGVWLHTWNFESATGPWTIVGEGTTGAVLGTYTAGSGFGTQQVPASPNEYVVSISLPGFPSTNLRTIAVYATCEVTTNYLSILDDEPPAAGGSGVTIHEESNIPDESVGWTGNRNFTDLYVYLRSGAVAGPAGSTNAFIRRVTVSGTGPNPFA